MTGTTYARNRSATLSSCRSAMSAPPQPCATFLDLPPEVRNKIYELVLIVPDIIWIHHKWSKNSRERQIPKQLDRYVDQRDPTPAVHLLLVSRRIHNETAPILYGSNRFELQDLRSIEAWTVQIGESIFHLRMVNVKDVEGPDRMSHQEKAVLFRLCMRNIAQASKLVSFHISHCYFEESSIARLLMPLMKGLQQGDRDGNEGDVTEVLQIVENWSDLRKYDSQHASDVRRRLRDLIRSPQELVKDEAEALEGMQNMFVLAENESNLSS